MKKLLIALSLVTVACSGSSITGPTATSGQPAQAVTNVGSGSAASASDASDPASGSAPASPEGKAPTPQFTVKGATGCVTAGPDLMRWILDITDAGPSALRFVGLAHNAMEPGCDKTIDNPRSRVTVTGVLDYAAHAAGQTAFTFDPRSFSCGRAQVDVSMFDAQGQEILIVGMVVDYGTVCAPPPPAPPVANVLQCTPGAQAVGANQPVSVKATGGTGAYEWSSPGAPSRGNGAAFATAFAAAGSYSVTVSSGNATATCVVDVTSTPPPPVVNTLQCAPATQMVTVDQTAALTASGGTGSFGWSGGAVPATGAGASFATSYAFPGTYPVTVTSGGAQATCQVEVKSKLPPFVPLQCMPATQLVTVNEPALLSAAGGAGSYTWTGGGAPALGSGSSFATSFAGPGTYTVMLGSGDLKISCAVTVKSLPPPPPPPPTPTAKGQGCTPGFWRQSHHFGSWTGYAPGTMFSAVFDDAFPGMTLGEVIAVEGGGLNALGRHVVAALLNASSPRISYNVSVTSVITKFNQVFPGGSYEALKNNLAGLNEQSCPLE